MAAKKKTRGGFREGAGRKPMFENRADLTVALEGSDYRRLVELAEEKGTSAGALVREAVRMYLARRRK